MSDDVAGQVLRFDGGEKLKAWLETQPREVSVAIAARAALRVAVFAAQKIAPRDEKQWSESFLNVSSAIFRATALARVAAAFPTRANGPHAAVDTDNLAGLAQNHAEDAVEIAATTAAHAAAAAASAVYGLDYWADAAEAVVYATGAAYDAVGGDPVSAAAAAAIWAEVSADASALAKGESLAAAPLWILASPDWAREHWARLRTALPPNEDWDVWTRWYEDRLAGRTHSEAHELVFATVPQEKWNEGPAAANRWIRERIEELEKLPQPGPGPRLTVRDQRLDIDLHRPGDSPPPSKRSKALLDELREAAQDFANGFDPTSNAHGQLRKVVERYRAQIDLDNPDVDVIFALGLRLENASLAAQRAISDRIEPELEDAQQEALASTVQIHAVYIVSEPDGVELLAAAERYAHRPEDDERFRQLAERVVDGIKRANDFATERASELVSGGVEEIGRGEHPARTGTLGRSMIQGALLVAASAAISGPIGDIASQTIVGQEMIAYGVSFANKAVEFFLTNADSLRALAAVAPEGFGFLGPLIDWIRAKL